MAITKQTMDGNEAAAYASYAFTEVAGIFPITPSSPMAEYIDAWSANGKKNIFGQRVTVTEMQSEGGAAGVVHGSLAAGALTTTYTASQGLLLMIPNMYKISGELLPGVMHVSARALAAHALSIFGDHSDVMSCRQTGFAMLASTNVQEIIDLGAIAHLAAIKGRVPFLHFFDGFRTSHEVQKVDLVDYEDYAKLIDRDALKTFRDNALNPEHPVLRGTAQNPDIFFQAKEASNKFYDALPKIVQDNMDALAKITGRPYKLFDYYGAPDADRVIIAMGSVNDTAEETIDYLMGKGEKVGLVKVRLYRPFVPEAMFAVMPKTVKKIAVLDRTKEPGALGEPLYQDVVNAYFEKGEHPLIVSGRYGLGSKDTAPGQIKAVYDNLDAASPKPRFTIGIVDDVSNLSLPLNEDLDTTPQGTKSCKFWGLGSDGTVGANKNSIKIIGDHTDMSVQAYFSYDSKKSGGITVSHLRFGNEPIKSTYFINKADFVACHNQSYVDKYDMVEDLKDGGTFLLNASWTDAELDEYLPAKMKRYIAEHNIKLYVIDAITLGKEIGLGNRINTVMQSAFFKLADIIPIEDAIGYMKAAALKSYGRRGEAVVKMNNDAIDRGATDFRQFSVPASWASAGDAEACAADKPDFILNVMDPMNAQLGHKLPVSTFVGREDGTFPQGTTKYEKRGVAIEVPEWVPDKCIQCNQCSYVCPHASIRPFLMDEGEAAAAPAGFVSKKAIGRGLENMAFRIQVSPLDCYGCGNCVDVCPAKEKAIVMKPLSEMGKEVPNWEHAVTLMEKPNPLNTGTVKGSQFEVPLLEFSGACAGCGETPYAKLVTQLFGDRMTIANATGCSSIWGGSAPAQPYTTNASGKGPAWANSLFEDNAEYGYGMFLGSRQIREKLLDLTAELVGLDGVDAAIKEAGQAWMEAFLDGAKTKQASAAYEAALKAGKAGAGGDAAALIGQILERSDFLVKRSTWVFGGDGWAYDIGFGGLDHVLASGEDVNILVFDTEVYSNTGGQSSKSTPTGAVAQFAASGKSTKKKDLGLMMTNYGYVYVAQVAMGANQNQTLRAILEAESYPGPSIVIAYSPCINHGIRLGMGCTQREAKLAVEAGYWHLFRFNPLLKAEGKNPFTLDSKEPTASYNDFIMGEVRYSSLTRSFKDRADVLFVKSEEAAKERYESYKRLAEAQ
ncbi:MAG: pyruvate:ferredoxin (flavodoxin) oxidoreductase [Oscillospiraceae bacterium]|nr:pyruvate:ferredoxin (flavodoxin) oxidoreductase [Oscillospiraceae bacterium]